MKKYIVITGGQMFNKGAEAMVYLAVDQLKKRYPSTEIVVLSTQDYKRSNTEKDKYDFEILPRDSHVLFPLAGGHLKYKGYYIKLKEAILFKKPYFKETKRLKYVLKNALMIVDISGFALSSQFNTGHSINYLSRIMIAKKYKIPYFIMPQSFGPFSYDEKIRTEINEMIKETLSYPKVIYAREEEGYNYLKETFNLENNLFLSMDSVLLSQKINLDNIFKTKPTVRDFQHVKGVGIIPNVKTFSHGNKNNIIEAYRTLIEQLLESDKVVYIIRHSYEDLQVCELIKNEFCDNNSVRLMNEDMSCLEFDKLVNNFDFIIGSRFHSIIHAYKNSVPSIAIGWATKYHELLSAFDQSEYIFDVRDDLDKIKLSSKLHLMLNNYNNESNKISEVLKRVQTSNPYDKVVL